MVSICIRYLLAFAILNFPALASATESAPAAAGSAAFNPAIGVIFTGQAWQYGEDPAGYAVQGFPFGLDYLFSIG